MTSPLHALVRVRDLRVARYQADYHAARQQLVMAEQQLREVDEELVDGVGGARG